MKRMITIVISASLLAVTFGASWVDATSLNFGW